MVRQAFCTKVLDFPQTAKFTKIDISLQNPRNAKTTKSPTKDGILSTAEFRRTGFFLAIPYQATFSPEKGGGFVPCWHTIGEKATTDLLRLAERAC